MRADEELEISWRLLCENGGNRFSNKLLHYIGDRKIHGKAWVEHAKTKMPQAKIKMRDDLGHYPQLEDSSQVASSLKEFIS